MASQSGQQSSAGAVGDGRVHDANEGTECHTTTVEDRPSGELHCLVAAVRFCAWSMCRHELCV